MTPLLINGKYYIECDIHMLPIDISKNDPNDCIGKLFLNENNVLTRLFDIEDIIKSNGYFNAIPQDLYIVLDDDNIKNEEHFLNGKYLYQANQYYEKASNDRKIIACTNKSLKDKSKLGNAFQHLEGTPLPQIPNIFIDYFMVNYKKENKIQKVLVEVLPPLYDGTEATAKLNYRLKLNEDGFVTILTELHSDIIQQLLDKKASQSSTIDLNEYANGLTDMYNHLFVNNKYYDSKQVIELVIDAMITGVNIRDKNQIFNEVRDKWIKDNIK